MSLSRKRPLEGAQDDFREQKKRITSGLSSLHIGGTAPPVPPASAPSPFGTLAFPSPAPPSAPAPAAQAPLTFDASFQRALDAAASPAPARVRRRERDADELLTDAPSPAKRPCRKSSRALIVYKSPFERSVGLVRRAREAAADTPVAAGSDAWLAQRVRTLNVAAGTQTIELDLTSGGEGEGEAADEMNVSDDSPQRGKGLSLVRAPSSAERRRAQQRAVAASMSPRLRAQTAILMPWRKEAAGASDADGDVEMG